MRVLEAIDYPRIRARRKSGFGEIFGGGVPEGLPTSSLNPAEGFTMKVMKVMRMCELQKEEGL
jgi:hypothetical protein